MVRTLDGLTGRSDQWPDQALVVEPTPDAPRARHASEPFTPTHAHACSGVWFRHGQQGLDDRPDTVADHTFAQCIQQAARYGFDYRVPRS